MDGRKTTGGKLEVKVKIREPLSGVEVQPVTEKWLVLDPVSSLSPPQKEKERVSQFLSLFVLDWYSFTFYALKFTHFGRSKVLETSPRQEKMTVLKGAFS